MILTFGYDRALAIGRWLPGRAPQSNRSMCKTKFIYIYVVCYEQVETMTVSLKQLDVFK